MCQKSTGQHDMSTNFSESFTRRLREERGRLDLSIAAVAKGCGVSRQSVMRWEDGTPVPSDKLALMILLGYDYQYLMLGMRSEDEGKPPASAALPPAERAQRALAVCVEAQRLLGVEFTADQFRMLLEYAYRYGGEADAIADIVRNAQALAGIELPKKMV